jgi:hypothetical protein
MIESTQKKLREARFFAQQFNRASQQPVQSEPEEAEYYLSAFLSAARAVTFALQHEEKDKYGDWRVKGSWSEKWFSGRSQEDQALLKAMVTHRNAVQKRGGPEMNQESEYFPVTEMRTDNRQHPAYGFHWYGPPGTPAPTVGMPVYSFRGSGDEVTADCQRYLELLDNLVRDFIETYKER